MIYAVDDCLAESECLANVSDIRAQGDVRNSNYSVKPIIDDNNFTHTQNPDAKCNNTNPIFRPGTFVNVITNFPRTSQLHAHMLILSLPVLRLNNTLADYMSVVKQQDTASVRCMFIVLTFMQPKRNATDHTNTKDVERISQIVRSRRLWEQWKSLWPHSWTARFDGTSLANRL